MSASPPPPPLRAAVVGLGLAGRFFHVPHLAANPNYEVTVLCQRAPVADADLAALAPRARVVHSVEEVIAAADVDVVVVASPDATHFDFASRALAAGKHVLVDKPFAQSLAQAAALLAQAARAGRACMPYQNRRHCADFATVAALLAGGRLGELVEYTAHYDRFRPAVRSIWKELDRGALDNLGPHVVDQAVLLFGEPERVWADVRALRDGSPQDDFFELHLFYAAARAGRLPGLVAPPRSKAVLRSTMLAAANDLKFVIHGLAGSFVKSGLDGQEAALCAGGPVAPPADGGALWEEPEAFFGMLTTAAGAVEAVPSLRGVSYSAMYDAFAASCRAPAPLAAQEVGPAQALLTMRVIETARLSAASGRVEPLVAVPAGAEGEGGGGGGGGGGAR